MYLYRANYLKDTYTSDTSVASPICRSGRSPWCHPSQGCDWCEASRSGFDWRHCEGQVFADDSFGAWSRQIAHESSIGKETFSGPLGTFAEHTLGQDMGAVPGNELRARSFLESMDRRYDETDEACIRSRLIEAVGYSGYFYDFYGWFASSLYMFFFWHALMQTGACGRYVAWHGRD